MEDIKNREDIHLLVTSFYKKVIPDPVIGHFFTSVVKLDWEHHIPIMIDFWESMLIGGSGYVGNPMDKHFALHKKSPMQPVHFSRWVELWNETVQELFNGPVATSAISRAASIAGIMEHKVTGR